MRVRTATALSLAVAAAALAGPSRALQVTGEGHTVFNGTAFVGQAAMTIGGAPQNATVTTVALEMSDLPTGQILAVTSHTFDFGGGNTIVTTDRARLTPTATPGVYNLDSQLTVTEGTGSFARATGHFVGLPGGTINLVTGHADWTLMGTVVQQP